MMSFLQRLRDGLVRMETWLAAISLLLLLALALLQILVRNLFDAGFADADTLTRYLVLYVTFFGAAVAIDRDRHIKIDVCCTLLNPVTLRKLYRPLRALAALVCAFFTEAAVRFWLDSWQYAPEHERWLVLVSLILPLGFGLLTIQFVLASILGQDNTACCTR
ncbi:MAG TPA: TRAP transporter small permease [Gammaproteobacteria bacterium]|nr:TRAP transporter small permease [Gammaproteobacteria bacterium]